MTDEPQLMTTFEHACNDARKTVKGVAAYVKQIVGSTKDAPPTVMEDRGEKIANLMLAYRHLEDASMRLGKALQAHDGGASVYDRETTVGA